MKNKEVDNMVEKSLNKWESDYWTRAWKGKIPNHRLVEKNEIILENDNLKSPIERGNWVNKVKEKIKKKYCFSVYDHNGKCPHIHIKNITGLEGLNEEELSEWKKQFIIKYGGEDSDTAFSDKRKLIPAEEQIHWKKLFFDKGITSYGGEEYGVKKLFKTYNKNVKNEAELIKFQDKKNINYSDYDLIEKLESEGNEIKNGFMTCPFHDDKVPSLRLYAHTNTYHCFGDKCGKTGKISDLLKNKIEFKNKPQKSGRTMLSDYDYAELYKIVSVGLEQGLTGEETLKEVEARLLNSVSWSILTEEEKKDIINNIAEKKKEEIDDTIEVETEIDFDPIIKICNGFNTHLKHYEDFEKDFNIRVENKDILTKAYYYKFHSLIQKPILVEINSIIDSDNRPHHLIMGSAGTGKGALRFLENKFCRALDIEKPTITSSVSNKEQLIGKVIMVGKGKEKEKIKKQGYLGKLSLQFDEAQDLLNEQHNHFAEQMILMRSAMDSFGRNEINKELVDDDPDFTLNYFSKSRITYFTHPTLLTNPFFQRGTARRFSLFFEIEEDIVYDVNNFTDMSMTCNVEPFKYFNDFKDENNGHNSITSLTYTTECLDVISSFTSSVLYFLITHKNPKISRFGIINRNVINLFFLKWINILHIAKRLENTNLETTVQALIDGLGFYLNNIQQFIKRGNIENQIPEWSELDDSQIWCLHYLLNNNATSLDNSKLSIKHFKDNVIARIYGVNSSQAWKYYNELKSKGFIKSKQIGKHSSKVWLSRVPNEVKIIDYDFFKSRGFEILLNELSKIAPECVEVFKGCKGDEGIGKLQAKLEELFKGRKGATVYPPLLNTYKDVKSFNFSFIFYYLYLRGGYKWCDPYNPKENDYNKNNNDVKIVKVTNQPKNPIIEYIEANDEGEGAEWLKILEECNVQDKDIQNMIKEGIIYEPIRGKVKVL